MNFLEHLEKYSGYVKEVDHVREQLTGRSNLSAESVLVPLVYKKILEYNDQKPIMSDMLMAASMVYFTNKWPELKSYFLTDKQKQTLDETKEMIELILKQQQEGHA